MAAATATATLYDFPKGVDNTQRYQILRGTIAVTYGTYPIGGFAVNWAALANAGGGRVEATPNPGASSILPVEVDVFSAAARPTGFIYLIDSAGNLRVFISANAASGTSGPLIEGVGPNVNVPADLVNDTIQFTAYFVRT